MNETVLLETENTNKYLSVAEFLTGLAESVISRDFEAALGTELVEASLSLLGDLGQGCKTPEVLVGRIQRFLDYQESMEGGENV